MPPGVTRGSLIAGCRRSGGWGFEFHILYEGGQHQLPHFALVYPLWKDARVRGTTRGSLIADCRHGGRMDEYSCSKEATYHGDLKRQRDLHVLNEGGHHQLHLTMVSCSGAS